MDIANNATFQYASVAAQTLSGVISGAGTLLKDTAVSTLSLTGVNTFTGDIDLDAGVLLVGASGQLESGAYTGAMDIANNATFQYASGAEQTLSGVISGAGTLLKDTAVSTLSLTGVNTFTGDIDLDAGVLLVGASGQLESGAYTGAMDIAAGTTFQYASGAAQTLSGVISGAGTLLKDTADSTLTLTGVNTYSGDIDLNTGRLTIGGVGFLESGAYTGAMDIAAGTTFQYASDAEQTLSGVISGAGTLLKDTAVSTLSLTGVNTFTGDIDLDAGVLLVGASGQLESGAYTGAMDIAAGTTFQYASDAAQTLSGVISGAGTLLKDTADSTLTLTGVNTFTGDIDLDAGVLLVGTSGQLESGAYTGAMDIAAGTTFQYASDAEQTLSGVISGAGTLLKDTAVSTLSLTGVNTFNGDIDLDTGVLLVGASGQLESGAYTGAMDIAAGTTFQYASDAEQTLSGVISGAGTLLKDTAVSTLSLTGVNTFNGDIDLDTGVLLVGASGQLESGAYTGAMDIANNATFQYASDAEQTLSGVISGAGTLLKDTAVSTLSLTGVNTFTGDIDLDRWCAVGRRQWPARIRCLHRCMDIADGSTFAICIQRCTNPVGSDQRRGYLTERYRRQYADTNRREYLQWRHRPEYWPVGYRRRGPTRVRCLHRCDGYRRGYDVPICLRVLQQTLSGVISGAGTLLKDTADSTLTLTGVNTFTGDIDLDAGVLLVGASGQLESGAYTGAMDIAAGTTFQYASDAEQTLSGVISGAGTLLKDTADSTLTLTGVNTFTGDIDLNTGRAVGRRQWPTGIRCLHRCHGYRRGYDVPICLRC